MTKTSPTTIRNAPAANSMAGSERFIRLSTASTRADRGGRHQERHREAQRNRTRAAPPPGAVLLRRDGQNARENRADARRPAGGEGHSDEAGGPERAPVAHARARARRASSSGMRIIPIMCRPRMTTSTPPICAISTRLRVEYAADRAGAQAECDENHAEADDEGDGVRERAHSRPSRSRLALRSSRLSPVSNERYAGTSGRTHGETKETRPARKAMPAVICVVAVMRRRLL